MRNHEWATTMSPTACSCSDRQSPSFCDAMGMKRELSGASSEPSRMRNITCPGLPANLRSASRAIRSASASLPTDASSISTPESWNELSRREMFQRSVL